MPQRLIDALGTLVDEGHYPNQSEALREGARNIVNEHDVTGRPVRTDGNGQVFETDPDTERERRENRRDEYGTLNPALGLLTSSELQAELPMLLARSNADGGRIATANGGEDTVTVELTYHVDGRLGTFGTGKTDLEDVRVVQLGNVYAALEPTDTVRDLFVKTGVPSHFPDTLEDALACYAVVHADEMDGHTRPAEDAYVDFNLSDVEDGNDLETHLVSDRDEPVYPTDGETGDLDG